METKIKALATDLDGTLIPLLDANAQDLIELKTTLTEHALKLAFVTGRHFSSASDAIKQYDLPYPDCIICDVGTSVYERIDDHFERHTGFDDYLSQITQGADTGDARAVVGDAEDWHKAFGLVEQEEEKQSRFKLSFYAEKQAVDSAANHIRDLLERASLPFSVVSSVDPFTQDGLIDVLPAGVAKGFALSWWRDQRGLSCEEVVYAGDSGNDTAAFLTGVLSILVGNMDEAVANEIERQHPQQEYIFKADSLATSGVLEGMRYFLELQS